MNTKFSIVVILAITAFVATAAMSSSQAFAKIEPVTRCDGEVDPDGCPGSSSGPGRGHDETSQNENPAGTAPPGQNK
jgi:hypothetical protein